MLVKQPAGSPTLLDSKSKATEHWGEREKQWYKTKGDYRQGTTLLETELSNGKDCVLAHVLLVLTQCSKQGFAVSHKDIYNKVVFQYNI